MTYTQPLTFLCTIAIWIALLRLPSSKGKKAAMAAALMWTLLIWPPVEWLLAQPLEAAYPIRPFRAPAGMAAIVVLSNAVSPPHFERPFALPEQETFRRCEYAGWIYRTTPVPVLASGGSDGAGQAAYAETMRIFLQRAGVPAGMIWTENVSRSTHENAVYSAEILRRHGVRKIALVVDARSMPRAAACFRREGMEVIPAPSSWLELSYRLEDWIPGWKPIRGNEETLHELAGLLWYRLRGWI
jgi:uncharacterized SAM-binding protein YcdF (DUF218 family)